MTPCARELAMAKKYREDCGRRSWEEGIGLTARHRDTERPEGRRAFEWERVVSCRNGDQRRRAELDFGSRQPLDDLHWAATLGAAPKTKRDFSGSNVLSSLRLLG